MARGPVLSSSRGILTRTPGPNPSLQQRGVPSEHVTFGDQHIGDAVAGQIDEAEVGVVPIQYRTFAERSEPGPAFFQRPAVKAGRARAEVDEVQVAVTGDIHQVLQPALLSCCRGLGPHRLDRAEPPLAEIVLVQPRTALRGEDTRDAAPSAALGSIQSIGLRRRRRPAGCARLCGSTSTGVNRSVPGCPPADCACSRILAAASSEVR